MVRPAPAALALLALLASGDAPAAEPARPPAGPGAPAASRAVVETIRLTGFDPEGEPEVQRLADGALRLLLEFMPPSFTDGHDAGLFERLEAHLSKALGVEVVREDRETFLVPAPRPDTLARLKEELAAVRRRYP